MRAFAIDHPLHKPGVSILHYKLFNGQQAGGVWRMPPFFGNGTDSQLHIRHNARRVPDIFSPDLSLVISQRVRDALGELPFVEYRTVIFSEPVDVPVPLLGDMNWLTPRIKEAAAGDGWPSNLFDYLPLASPKKCTGLGDYYEVIVPRLKEALAEFPEAREITIPWPHTIDEQNTFRVCSALLAKYPVFWWSQFVFAEPVFRSLEPFLDHSYADAVEFEVS